MKDFNIMKNFLIIALVLTAVVQTATVSSASRPASVILSEARLLDFHDRVEALGTLRANESVTITATITDTITAIHFTDGQRVQAKDILVEMTSAEEHAILEEELSNLKIAEKQLKRFEMLLQKEASTDDQLEQRSRDFETAKARFRQIESRLQDRLILAPFAGVVGLRNISVGALVEPGDIITTLDDDTTMKLDFAVPAIHLSTLKMGLTVEATAPSYGKRVFTGKVSGISSRIDETTRSIIVRAVLPNPERLLKPGMLMSVELLKNPREALVIPEEALLPMGSSNYVLVVDPSAEQARTEKRLVQLGSRRPGEVEIIQGLTAGEFVVIHGALKARPGQPVHIVAVKTGEQTLEQLLSKKAENKKQ